MAHITIRNRYSGAIMFEGDTSDLNGANLSGAHLRGARLGGVGLYDANLSYANLSGASLVGAESRGANLIDADLSYADLSYANLRGAHLSGANLYSANLSGAKLPPFQIVPQEGSFTGYKKLRNGKVIRVQVPDHACRTSSLVGRKCRASVLIPLDYCGEEGNTGPNHPSKQYVQGQPTTCDDFDSDIRVECARGLHFFMTREEAEEWYA